jgi:predicted nucleotidyltransferase
MTDVVRELAEQLNTKRDAILEIAARHGASNVRIFGSVARQEARHDSDVDILVDLEPGRTLLDHAALMIELEELLNCKVDVATERGLKARIRDRVLAEAVPL